MIGSPFVDAHIHFWDPELLRYEWLDGEGGLNRPHLPADVPPVMADLPSFVFVQADARPDQGLSEARWVHELSEAWPQIAGVVAFAPLEEGADVSAHLNELSELSRVVGIRRLLQSEDEAFFHERRLHAGLDAVQASGFTFDACVRHHQLPALIDAVKEHPELPVALDHLGKPPLGDGISSAAGQRWVRNIRTLAALPNVVVKLSGLPAEVRDAEYPRSAYRPWLLEALEAFGSARAMYGSDWPVSANGPSAVDYEAWREIVFDLVAADAATRDDLGWRTASTFYGLGLGRN